VAEVDVSHICTSLKMADVAMPHQMFADIPSLIARLPAPFSRARAALGQIRGDER